MKYDPSEPRLIAVISLFISIISFIIVWGLILLKHLD